MDVAAAEIRYQHWAQVIQLQNFAILARGTLAPLRGDRPRKA